MSDKEITKSNVKEGHVLFNDKDYYDAAISFDDTDGQLILNIHLTTRVHHFSSDQLDAICDLLNNLNEGE